MDDILRKIGKCVEEGEHKQILALVREALDSGVSPQQILSLGFIANGMDIMGRRFRDGECFVPEVLSSARAMHVGMDMLKPMLTQSGNKPIGRAVIGTVYGDHHDIGKKIVAMMLEGGGFEVRDIGINVAPDVFVAEALKFGAQIIGMSTLLTTTISSMEKTCALIRQSELGGKVKVIVGGAPVSEKIALQAGADGYAENAGEAVFKARELLQTPGR